MTDEEIAEVRAKSYGMDLCCYCRECDKNNPCEHKKDALHGYKDGFLAGLKARLNAINLLTPELEKQSKVKKQQLTKAKEIIDELSKSLFLAKGLIRDLIDDTVDFKESKERAIYCYEQEKFDAYKEAEQFLKEEEN